MLRPILKQWLDEHLPRIVDEHVQPRNPPHYRAGRSRLRNAHAALLAPATSASMNRILLRRHRRGRRPRLHPAVARPMTATDMHMMHRLGAPSVSPDGRYAIFTLSTPTLPPTSATMRCYMLDLAKAGATPQPLAGIDQGRA